MRNATDPPCDRGDDGVWPCPVCHDIQDLSDVGRSRRRSWHVVPLCMPQHTKLVGCRQILPFVSAAHPIEYVSAYTTAQIPCEFGIADSATPCCACLDMRNPSDASCPATTSDDVFPHVCPDTRAATSQLALPMRRRLPWDHRCHSAKHISVCRHIQQPRCGDMPQRGVRQNRKSDRTKLSRASCRASGRWAWADATGGSGLTGSTRTCTSANRGPPRGRRTWRPASS